MLVNFAVTTVVSLATKEPPADIQDQVEHLRYPDQPPPPAIEEPEDAIIHTGEHGEPLLSGEEGDPGDDS